MAVKINTQGLDLKPPAGPEGLIPFRAVGERDYFKQASLEEVANLYLEYRVKDEYTDESEDFISAVILESVSNCPLKHKIDLIDQLIEEDMASGELPQLDRIRLKLLFHDLLSQLRNLVLEGPMFNEFKGIIQEFSTRLFNDATLYEELYRGDYFPTSEEGYVRNLIVGNERKTILVYAIGWLPGQITEPHHHGDDLDAILVIDGELAHWRLKFCSHNTEDEVTPSELYAKKSTVTIDRLSCHKLGSLDSKLKTLHIRVVGGDASHKDAPYYPYEDIRRSERWYPESGLEYLVQEGDQQCEGQSQALERQKLCSKR